MLVPTVAGIHRVQDVAIGSHRRRVSIQSCFDGLMGKRTTVWLINVRGQ